MRRAKKMVKVIRKATNIRVSKQPVTDSNNEERNQTISWNVMYGTVEYNNN